MIDESPEFFAILLELHTLGRHNEEIAAEVAELHRRVRGHLALILTAARDAGAITLADEPEVVAEMLFALADGLALWMLAEPGRDFGPTVAAATRAAAALILPAYAAATTTPTAPGAARRSVGVCRRATTTPTVRVVARACRRCCTSGPSLNAAVDVAGGSTGAAHVRYLGWPASQFLLPKDAPPMQTAMLRLDASCAAAGGSS